MLGRGYSEDELNEELAELKILVVGCGGAGCNSVDRLNSLGLRGAETIAINTDRAHLKKINSHRRLLIGSAPHQGLGAGGIPQVGMAAMENALEPLNDVLIDTDLTFITVGMGGGTGTGVAPIVAEQAKRHGSIVISMATTPFDFEKRRWENAAWGIRRLDHSSDMLLLLDNNRLTEMFSNLPVEQAFGVMDQLISEVIKGLVEAITEPSLVNLDFADLKTIMKQGGVSTILYGESTDPEGCEGRSQNPLLRSLRRRHRCAHPRDRGKESQPEEGHQGGEGNDRAAGPRRQRHLRGQGGRALRQYDQGDGGDHRDPG